MEQGQPGQHQAGEELRDLAATPEADLVPQDAGSVDQALDKYQAAWGAGYPNLETILNNYYTALFDPDSAGDILNADAFPGRRDELTARMNNGLTPENAPSRDDFIEAMRTAINREAEYDSALYDGALETIESLANHGDLTIWTAGDAGGMLHQTDDGEELWLPGSNHQLHKMIVAGIGENRRRLALDSGKQPSEVHGVIASEDKFQGLPDLFAQLQEDGRNQIMVVDDRIQNLKRFDALVKAYNLAHDYNLESTLCLADYSSEHGQADEPPQPTETALDIVVLGQITDAIAVAEGLPDRTKILLDYDGTLSDDQKRLDATRRAITHVLTENSWV